MNEDDLTKEELLSRFLQLEQRVEEVEQENTQLREQLQEKDERIDELEARLRKYENPHTPPSKRRCHAKGLSTISGNCVPNATASAASPLGGDRVRVWLYSE